MRRWGQQPFQHDLELEAYGSRMGYVIAGVTIIALAAWMAHGEEPSWFNGTLQMIGIMALLGTGAALLIWVATYGS